VSAPRLYIDEDAAEKAVVMALRQHGFDVLTVQEAGGHSLGDDAQLRFAAANGRVLYSLNVSDFARLHQEFSARGEEHAGIILIPRQRYSIGEKARRLQDLLESTDAEALRNTLHFL
jgi:hypothetical protein